jgi:hypothetical protein
MIKLNPNTTLSSKFNKFQGKLVNHTKKQQDQITITLNKLKLTQINNKKQL